MSGQQFPLLSPLRKVEGTDQHCQQVSSRMPETDSDSVFTSRYWVGELHPIFTVNPVPLCLTRIIRLLHATRNDVRFREDSKRKPADNCVAIASGFSSQVSPTLFRVSCCRHTTAGQIVGLACSVVNPQIRKKNQPSRQRGATREGSREKHHPRERSYRLVS